MKQYDAIIIGFGKGGKLLAAELAERNWKVAIVERSPQMYGGTCVNVGCIPTKALIHESEYAEKRYYDDYKNQSKLYALAVARKDKLVSFLREKNYENVKNKPNITLYDGTASFLSENTIRIVSGKDETILEGKEIFINTGSTPILPAIDGLKESKYVYTSETLLQSNKLPAHLLVIGGGPAGYTAALYAARAGLSTLVLEKLSAGGQMALTEQIDNYPGFESGIDGFTLGEKMQQSAERFGAVTELAEVYKASLSGRIKTLDTSEGVFQSRTVVVATGASPRPLGVPGEDALVGKGVHYCAACDGAPYRGKTVTVVGGGNSAAADALTLSRIAKKVYLIHRRDSLRATKVYHEPLMNAPNVEFCWNSTVSALLHESRLTGLRLKDVNTDAEHDLACDGVFISVGRAPATELFRRELTLDKSGYIIADESTRTNLPGVFAAGDVRTKALRQVVTAVSDGAVAVHYAEEYLAENR